MRRIIEFSYQEEEYLLQEGGVCIFTIKASDLKFNSVDFYTGVYKNKSSDIELVNKIMSDPLKKGDYIFTWLSEIVSAIRAEFTEKDPAEGLSAEVEASSPKLIPLFEFAVCAGAGFYIDDSIPHSDIPDTTGVADYAVTVSGKSMEPTIMDNSVIFVKKEDQPEHKDIGLFVVNGDVMCKRYIKQGRGYRLEPDNGEYEAISGRTITSLTYLGRVILK